MNWLSREELIEYKDVLVECGRSGIKLLPEDWPLSHFQGDFYLPALGGTSGLEPKEIQKRLLQLMTNNRDYSKNGAELYVSQKARPQEIILFMKRGRAPLEPDLDLYNSLRKLPEYKRFKEISVARSLDPSDLRPGSEWIAYDRCDMCGNRY